MNPRLAILAALVCGFAEPVVAASPPPVGAAHAMAVTAQHLATDVGVQIMRQGGNAVDAAVAVGYALAVVYPAAGNIGGGGFMTIRFADGRATFLDFRERAPLAATRTMYQDASGAVVPGLTTAGWLAVGVPGSVAGLEAARARFGTLPRETLMAPAIRLARDGYVLGPGDVAILREGTRDFRKDPAAASIFLKDGQPLATGDRLVQPALADTLALISAGGADAFYRGPVADAIVAASEAGHGILQAADFQAYQVRELPPVECSYRGYQVISAPPPSSGGVTLCEILTILEGYDLAAMGFHSAAEIHVLAETMRHAYVDRNNRLGDPAFVANPIAELLDRSYAARIRARIADRASPSIAAEGAAPAAEGSETTHYSIVDAAGNAVAVTYTLNGWFGIRRVAGATGILMNNEMDDFTAKPGVPNSYGLVQGEANAVAPGKTPLSSMSPTIVAKDGRAMLVIGSPGGSRIITITLEAIVNLIDHAMTIQEAIDAPRIHQQWLPDTVFVERFAVSPDTGRILAGMGYSLTEGRPWGLAEGILVGGPRLGPPPTGSSTQTLSVSEPAVTSERLFGATDARGSAGSAGGY